MKSRIWTGSPILTPDLQPESPTEFPRFCMPSRTRGSLSCRLARYLVCLLYSFRGFVFLNVGLGKVFAFRNASLQNAVHKDLSEHLFHELPRLTHTHPSGSDIPERPAATTAGRCARREPRAAWKQGLNRRSLTKLQRNSAIRRIDLGLRVLWLRGGPVGPLDLGSRAA